MDLNIEIFSNHPILAILISLIASVIISIAGILPSTFITAGNIAYFGFSNGLILSILGEALGAIVSFYLYRKGINKFTHSKTKTINNKLLRKLRETNNVYGFILVIALRIFPFVPSGLVTLTAAVSKMSLVVFSIASTLGKIPALYIEALSIHTVLSWKQEYQLVAVITTLILILICFLYSKNKRS
ncbi:VTT domain-containing protein (plasmid) [Bacillus sp. 31A1R]|uniref:TVP38/TMEM64 family membrane protein n=1 Tax=Robertmurraya mangrovi TaxID=3098077 RepID=A0ABU5IUS2_9BACI|nr:VTT domain-containing protein [Bacillus sp. 31A1R]MDZ5470902.1 VTT domain-containing protein [Bacillus sp. 31A1R]